MKTLSLSWCVWISAWVVNYLPNIKRVTFSTHSFNEQLKWKWTIYTFSGDIRRLMGWANDRYKRLRFENWLLSCSSDRGLSTVLWEWSVSAYATFSTWTLYQLRGWLLGLHLNKRSMSAYVEALFGRGTTYLSLGVDRDWRWGTAYVVSSAQTSELLSDYKYKKKV